MTSRGARAHGCRRIRVSNPHSPADSRFTVTCLPGTATVNARLCPNLSLRPFLRPETVSWAALCPTRSNSPGNSEWDLIRRQGQRRRHELRRNEVPLEQDGLRHGWRPCGSGTFGRRGGRAARTAWEEDGDGAMRQTPRTSPEHGATDPALRPQRGPAGPAPDSQAPASRPRPRPLDPDSARFCAEAPCVIFHSCRSCSESRPQNRRRPPTSRSPTLSGTGSRPPRPLRGGDAPSAARRPSSCSARLSPCPPRMLSTVPTFGARPDFPRPPAAQTPCALPPARTHIPRTPAPRDSAAGTGRRPAAPSSHRHRSLSPPMSTSLSPFLTP